MVEVVICRQIQTSNDLVSSAVIIHGDVQRDEIDRRGGMLVTFPRKLPCLKIFSDNLGDFQIMLVGGQDL